MNGPFISPLKEQKFTLPMNPMNHMNAKNILNNLEEIDNTVDDFILMGYCHIEDSMRISMVGTDKSGTVLKIISYPEGTSMPTKKEYTMKNKIFFIIPVDSGISNSVSLLVVHQKDEGGYSINMFATKNIDKNKSDPVFILLSDTIPLVIANSDLNSCLLYQFGDGTFIYDLVTEKKTKIENFDYKFSYNHSSAFIDIDGDLKPELVMMVNHMNKTYLHIYEDDYTLKQDPILLTDSLNFGPIVFGDFNASGCSDIAFVTQNHDNTYSLNILFNRRTRIRDKNNNIDDLFSHSNNSKFEKKCFDTNQKEYLYSITLKTKGENESQFIPQLRGEETMTNISCGIHVADFDLDSYPDIILTGAIANKPYILILENKFSDDKMDFNQHFYPVSNDSKCLKNEEIYNKTHKIISVSVADIFNNGEEYLIVNQMIDNVFSLSFIKNKASKDFYKVSTTTRYRNKGFTRQIIPGISYKYYIDEEMVTRIGNQNNQSSFLHLQVPYFTFGLGSVNFLIDKFYIGMVDHGTIKDAYLVKSKILPNSIVVFRPNSKGTVVVQLYLRFSEYLTSILIVIVLVLIVNLIVVAYGYRKEVKKEKLNRKKESHLFNFSAL